MWLPQHSNNSNFWTLSDTHCFKGCKYVSGYLFYIWIPTAEQQQPALKMKNNDIQNNNRKKEIIQF